MHNAATAYDWFENKAIPDKVQTHRSISNREVSKFNKISNKIATIQLLILLSEIPPSLFLL